jgi:hypothetical protein
MIDRVLELKPILTLLFIQNEEFKRKKFSEDLWETLEELRNLLKPFYDATNLISASEYPSLCIALPLYDSLISHLNCFNSNNQCLNECAGRIKTKLSAYEESIKSDLAIFSAMIDPRLKVEFFDDYDNVSMLKEKFALFYEQNYKSQFSSQVSPSHGESASFKESLYKKRRISSSNDEIKKFFESTTEDYKVEPDKWWLINRESYPILSKMAFDLLAIPATSVPSEQIFSKAGDLITQRRNRLNKKIIKTLMLLESWLKFFND